MAAITQGEVRVRAAIPFTDIGQLHMQMEKNRHAVIRLTGSVSEEVGEDALLQSLGYSGLEVWAGEEVLFRGIVKETYITREGNGYEVVLKGVSASQLLDCTKKNRTFQNVNSTYMDVIQTVLEDTSGAGMIFMAEDEYIGKPLYQIEETDWEFILRLASRMSAAVVPSALSAGAGIYIGLPNGRRWKPEGKDAVREKICFDRKRNCIWQEIGTYENRNIGDYLKWQGQESVIVSKRCELRRGLLYFIYGISKAEAFTVSRFGNPKHTGRLLPAVVLDTQEEQVKVKFDMDRMQKVEEAYWYPWRPDVGNLMYCMPEKGEKVYVQLWDCDGEHARAVCGEHGNGEGNPEMKHTERYFTTADRKRMYLTPKTIGFRDLKQKEALEVELHDSIGAAFRSNKKIVITAKETIGLKGNNISVQSPQELSIVRRNPAAPTVINMCNGFDSVGASNEVTMKGAGEPGFPVFQESGQSAGRNFGLVGVEQTIVATTPGIKLQSIEEMQIGAGMVNRAMMLDVSDVLVEDCEVNVGDTVDVNCEVAIGSKVDMKCEMAVGHEVDVDCEVVIGCDIAVNCGERRYDNERSNKNRWNGKESGNREIKPFSASKQSDAGGIRIESAGISIPKYEGNGNFREKKADRQEIRRWL